MSKFITFNGVDFFNSDKIEGISINTHHKLIGKKEYMSLTVETDDLVMYESEDFKTYDEGNLDNNFKAFNDLRRRISEEILSAS